MPVLGLLLAVNATLIPNQCYPQKSQKEGEGFVYFIKFLIASTGIIRERNSGFVSRLKVLGGNNENGNGANGIADGVRG